MLPLVLLTVTGFAPEAVQKKRYAKARIAGNKAFYFTKTPWATALLDCRPMHLGFDPMT